MARRSIAARAGVVVASVVLAAVGGILALTVFGPTPAPVAAQAVEPPLESDHCYVDGMLMHHAQALELSQLVLAADGVSDRVRALASFIIADQTAEMATMTAWSTAWLETAPAARNGTRSAHGAHGEPSAPAPSGCSRDIHTTMSGMATPEQLAALDAADGDDAQRMFLDLMIVHHQGALVMARAALVDGANAFVRSSAKHVLVEQQREIDAMADIVREMP